MAGSRGTLRVVTTAALPLFLIYLAVAFGVRTWLRVRRTADTGFPTHRCDQSPSWSALVPVAQALRSPAASR